MTHGHRDDRPARWDRDRLVALSRAAGADRLPDLLPAASGRDWFYPPTQYEAGALHRLIAQGRGANRHVDYAENVGGTARRAIFRTRLPASTPSLAPLTTGEATARADGVALPLGADGVIDTSSLAAGSILEIEVRTADATIPPAAALPAVGWTWEASMDGARWERVSPRPGDDVPPHERGEPTVELPLRPISDAGSDLYGLDAPVLGRVQIVAASRPVLTTGESPEEAAAGPGAGESRFDLTETAPGVYLSDHALGFRYAAVTGAVATTVTVHAHVRPAPRRGAFLTDDEALNRIWATSAYTLRLCMQTLLVDGIKRDRMPWMGDHALGVLTNAAAFADADIVRTTLRALGRPTHGYVNGISDYSLWWVISHGLYQRQFGDVDFALDEAEHVHAFMTDLAAHADADGVLRPPRVAGSFAHAGPGAVFLDWGVSVREDGTPTALQILWHWALTSAALVLEAAGHPGSARWHAAAAALKTVLVERAWRPAERLWSEYLDEAECASAYPNFLAILAGLDSDPSPASALLAQSAGGTPFMRAFALLALGRAGERNAAVAEVRRLWSGMLDAGATTFWEEFVDAGSPWEMYGRPFGKSLCHAWSAGPAALLPELVLGIRPLADGWRRFTVDPRLGSLGWAAAVTPTPHGDIVTDARPGELWVTLPAGTTLVVDAVEYPGPAEVLLPSHPSE
ncbi:alpha-L-rhamnosidase-related protein [Microbacterium sp. zg.Y909]|uniref:alpha-L-rhamnosidase-related protein n=1 Tax=Microbacterium sp. zg.Y909 TaxID=2969413 RepID=UPI00214AC200|nr:alpha-L-rhamnosidase C-terminal domain-containing protein [Microbacterium sp. zg.Y909]MCR2824384.1 hypothetical protein [Microbacterium sp. zg.Y909]